MDLQPGMSFLFVESDTGSASILAAFLLHGSTQSVNHAINANEVGVWMDA